jgi:UDP-N-acetylmuramyl pentapeptide phosphotransferase/UDP-N-acetylglucosamine-1-phosphate transferase
VITYFLILTPLLAAALGYTIIPKIVELSHELHIFDLPDSRKVHKLPVPRLGGVVFLPIVIIAVAVAIVVMLRFNIDTERLWKGTVVQTFVAYLGGVMMLYIVGLYDDLHGVGYKTKFLVQIAAASILCVSGLWVSNLQYVFFIEEIPFWIGMPLTVLFTVYVTNAMNLIDGIDGLASGLSIIALSVIAMLNGTTGDTVWALISLAYIGVLATFFYYNVFGNRHKTFMGDAGSLTLGFTLSFLILHYWQLTPVWNPHFHNVGIVAVSTIVIPCLDVPRVMLSRLRDGRNPFLPDKNHVHHKLLRAGLSSHAAMLTLVALSLMFVIANYIMAAHISQTVMLVVDILLFVVMHLVINHFIYKKEKGKQEYQREYEIK